MLQSDRLLPTDTIVRSIARTLYEGVRDAPLVCPHGHCEASWFVDDAAFANATDLLITPDHYVLRMLASQGVCYEALGVPRADGSRTDVDPRAVFRLFAGHYHLFAGTPSRVWLDHALHEVLGVPDRLSAVTADASADVSATGSSVTPCDSGPSAAVTSDGAMSRAPQVAASSASPLTAVTVIS